MTYYRKLDRKLPLLKGDGYMEDGEFTPYSHHFTDCGKAAECLSGPRHFGIAWRPVTITEAKPEPPAHRVEGVESETWFIFANNVMTRGGFKKVCWFPLAEESPNAGDDYQRAKRICAGQEALKFIEKYGGRAWALDFRLDEMQRILALLK